MNTTKCNGCGFNVNTDPCNCNIIPPNYPYNRPARDSYTFCCCGGTTPPINQYPSAGPFVGSAFMMNDGNPFIMDSTQMTYGAVLTYSESVYTHLSKRDDLSCINLTGVFDMTDTSLTNTVRNDFLKQYISRKYMELQGVLPIVKTTFKFRIYYTITDMYGGTIQQRHVDTNVTDSKFHFTDIRDRYVQSAKGLVIDNIPAITYQGLYNITIDRIELIVGIIDTKQHLVDAMNPFYQFVDNNQHIRLQSETIKNTPQDIEITVASCDVNRSFDYQANVTNRLRLTFTAFTSLPIACGDTMGIWNALNEPTDAVITQLRNEVTALEDEVRLLHEKDAEQDARIATLEGQVELNKNNISGLTSRVTALESAVSAKDAVIADILARLEALESVHKALVSYKQGKQFYQAQLTWKYHGELYQATKDFVCNGSFDYDVANGNLVPVSSDAVDISALVLKVDEVEQTANDADALATETANTVTVMSETVASLDTRVTDLEEADLSKNKVVIKNLETGEKQYVGSYGAAATILKEDLDGAYKVYPGEGYSQYTISAETFKNVTSLKEIELPSSTYEIGKDAFRGSGLRTFSITSNITTTGTDICGECLDLTTVTIESPNLDLKEGAFEKCTNLTTANIIAVDRMRTSCFYKTGLTTVKVPETVSEIQTGIFSSCPNLVSVTIGASTIGDHVVSSSTNLETIDLLSNVSSVDSNAFQGAPTGVTINVHKYSLSGSPWGAVDPVINWNVPNN